MKAQRDQEKKTTIYIYLNGNIYKVLDQKYKDVIEFLKDFFTKKEKILVEIDYDEFFLFVDEEEFMCLEKK